VNVLAVKIRLARAGAKKAPFYRVVAADSRAPRDGRFIEILGRYNPRTDPSTIELNVEKIDAWIAKGAQLSETVEKLLAIAKNPEAAAPAKESALSKKAQAKAEAEAKAAAQAPAAVEAPAEAVVEEAPEPEAVVEDVTEPEAVVEEAAEPEAAEAVADASEEATEEAAE